MNKLAGAFLLVVLTGLFSSCSFYKVVSGKRTKDPNKKVVWTGADTTAKPVANALEVIKDTVVTPAPVTVNPLIAQLKPLWTKRLTYKTFNGKAKMHFDGPDQNLEFTGHIRMKKDSAIWINISAIGGVYNAARIFITPDSFCMINYLKKQYTILPLTQADKFLPTKVDFSSLQNLIVGDPLREGEIKFADIIGDSIVLQIEDTGYLQRIIYNKADSTMRTGHLSTHKVNGPQAITDYDGYMIESGRNISSNRAINLINGIETYILNMNFTKITLDEPVEMPFNIPAKYTRK